MNFADFFNTATGKTPYDYQCRLACGSEARTGDLATLQTGTTCQSLLINIPTGLGKTAAVVLAWLWNRVNRADPGWPRRLVYCLPMRTLVEQTEKEIRRWLGKSLWDGRFDTRSGRVGVHVLMGGDELPALVVDGQSWPALRLSLTAMQMGRGKDDQPSWLEACLELRDSSDLGPFRLAYLESLLRAADMRASKESGKSNVPQPIS